MGLNKNDIISALPDMVFIFSGSGNLLEFKPSHDKSYLQILKNYKAKSIDSLFSSELADQFHYFIQQALKKESLQICEFKIKEENKERDFEARFSVCGEGEVLVLVREITLRKSAERQMVKMLVQSEENHDNMISILNQLRLGTAMTDKEGNVTFISEAGYHLLGLKTEIIGQDWSVAFPLSDQEIVQIQNMCHIAPKRRLKIPVHITASPDQNYWIDVEVKDHPQDAHKKIFLLYDVTELHTLRKMLDEKTEFQQMVGQSQRMQSVFQQIRELAPLDITVLIEGETGTGKELVARAMHALSPRKDRPFIVVNCAGLTNSSLLSSQLFGHTKGAFTGAIQDQKGFIEAADGGTLFLDELGDIPADVQTSLLRFLQEKEIIRLGEQRPRKVNVRILAATQHDLMNEVKRGRFRSDLYYRIHVASISLPPLKDRMEDLPLLIVSFLERLISATGKKIKNLSQEAMQSLMKYTWPGNVRELQGVLESSSIRCERDVIEISDLPKEIRLQNEFENTDDERQKIQLALEKTRGNRAAAARLLGMSRATFYRRLDEFGLSQIEHQNLK